MSEDSTPRVSVEYGEGPQHHIDVEYSSAIDHAVAEMSVNTPDESLVDDLPASMDFEVMAFGGQATVCASAPKRGRRSTAHQSETELKVLYRQLRLLRRWALVV